MKIRRPRDEFVALGRRTQQVILWSAVTGLLTGAGVGVFEKITAGVIFEHVTHSPLAVQAAAPLVGLLLAAASLRWLAAGASPSTADEYIKNFHERDHRLPLRPVLGRLVASVSTLGFGGAMGYEGPSLYLGASVGSLLQRRLKVGYARAGRIMDMLEAKGIAGPPDGSKPREVLIDIEDLESLKAFERHDASQEESW